jgi:hypothetical protein
VVVEHLPAVQPDEQIAGTDDVGVTLGGQRGGTRVLVLEVIIDTDQRFDGRRRRTTTGR